MIGGIQLDSESFHIELPVHLLNDRDQQTYRKDPRHPPAAFADGAGLHRFTEVYFNKNTPCARRAGYVVQRPLRKLDVGSA